MGGWRVRQLHRNSRHNGIVRAAGQTRLQSEKERERVWSVWGRDMPIERKGGREIEGWRDREIEGWSDREIEWWTERRSDGVIER